MTNYLLDSLKNSFILVQKGTAIFYYFNLSSQKGIKVN